MSSHACDDEMLLYYSHHSPLSHGGLWAAGMLMGREGRVGLSGVKRVKCECCWEGTHCAVADPALVPWSVFTAVEDVHVAVCCVEMYRRYAPMTDVEQMFLSLGILTESGEKVNSLGTTLGGLSLMSLILNLVMVHRITPDHSVRSTGWPN